ncbi:MAG TPA: isoprenylcysteine carboxylmethyltransferase family protein [Candidatus Acidoferrum sp.]|nr:isoprenylcysteine carboxylmethyltransferase family protein [Candidatus Acidoferrum sp.]
MIDPDGKAGARIDRSPVLSRVVRYIDAVILAVFYAIVISQRDYGARFWIGVSIAAVGTCLWGLARIQLGQSFSVGAQARQLVTTGLYAKFRNPIYLFGGIAYVGLFIALGNWILLAVFLALYSFQIGRVKREERVLEAAFGDGYRRYRASTWF